MRSTQLSLEEWRRLDEVCDDWAAWFCDRWTERPGLEKQHLFRGGTGYWDEQDQMAKWDERNRGLQIRNEDTDKAIDSLFDEHRRVLHAWAWESHYSRAVQRKVFRSNQMRVPLTPVMVDEAKLALLPKLRARAVM